MEIKPVVRRANGVKEAGSDNGTSGHQRENRDHRQKRFDTDPADHRDAGRDAAPCTIKRNVMLERDVAGINGPPKKKANQRRPSHRRKPD